MTAIKMPALRIIYTYYRREDELRRLLLHHSRQVAERCHEVLANHPELNLDVLLIHNGAMLHDIGIKETDAPGIHCHGTAHYLFHGILGARILRKEGLEYEARICERHTGTGLTPQIFADHGLEMPLGIFTPLTMEEKLVCYADKFFSKSHPDHTRTLTEAVRSLEKFGDDCVETFLDWHRIFG